MGNTQSEEEVARAQRTAANLRRQLFQEQEVNRRLQKENENIVEQRRWEEQLRIQAEKERNQQQEANRRQQQLQIEAEKERKQRECLQKEEERAELQRLSNLPEPHKIHRLGNFMWDQISSYAMTTTWTRQHRNSTLKFITLPKHCEEYRDVFSLYKSSNKWFNYLESIKRIENPVLLSMYLLKKEELRKRQQCHIKEELMFHGTKSENVDSICKNNFDWRKHGQNNGHYYGKGVAFTPISFFATHYTDKDTDVKVMIVARVLIGKVYDGAQICDVAPEGFDTALLPKSKVYVKFEDNEFYPAYKITYRKKNEN